MTFKKIAVEASLWLIFFSFAVLAFAISVDYTAFTPYMTFKQTENLLLLSALMSSGLAGALIYIHGIKSWTTFPIGIGLIMAWWYYIVLWAMLEMMNL